nr:DUF434 domain-containing protein [uncultured Flavobacterium sp.]
METKPKNRGKSSEDDKLFSSAKEQQKIRQALADLFYLLSRDYPLKSSLALAGNRYRLKTRQLMALQGMTCSEQEIALRKQKELPPALLSGSSIYLDGFNILIVLESILSGAYVFKGIDGCYRDISSVHGTYKRVLQTEQVLLLVGNTLKKLGAEKVIWVFDKPVSNSGKMKAMCYEIAETHGFRWDALLDNNPDKYITDNKRVACSSDAWVLNECDSWFNLTAYIIDELIAQGNSFNIITP